MKLLNKLKDLFKPIKSTTNNPLNATRMNQQKAIKINRNLTVSESRYSHMIRFFKKGKSMNQYLRETNLNMPKSHVAAVRNHMVKSGVLPMKESTVRGHETRKRLNEVVDIVKPANPQQNIKFTEEALEVAGSLKPTVGNALAYYEDFCSKKTVIDKDEVMAKQSMDAVEAYEEAQQTHLNNDFLTIDYKGMEVEIKVSSKVTITDNKIVIL